ncbi:hypothetical protein N9U84_00715 [Candidatus Pelagibacter sp.]|nr:hypothetical protein [Candidatus Pelagibacter sp.]
MKIDIFILFFFYFISIFSTLGYGIFLQGLNNISKNNKICLGYSGLIGVFFLITYSYISHFFYSHGIYHNLFVLILGLLLLYISYLKKSINKLEINILTIVFLIIFFSFLIFKSHDDFPYYHFPYTYYLNQNSLIFGIGHLNHGFRTPSSLFYFNSLFYLPIIKYHLFHIGSAIIFGSVIFIFFSNIKASIQKKNISYIYFFDLLALIFILVFFYRLAEHGTDRSAQILVLLIISEIFKVLILKKITFYEISKLSILFAITISLKAIYFLYGLLLLPLFFIIIGKIGLKKLMMKLLLNPIFYFSIILLSLVLVTNFFNTGCLIYPLSGSCFTSFEWSIQTEEIKKMALHYENWSKAGMTPIFKVDDPAKYVENFNWVHGWLDRYFFFKFSDFLISLIFLKLIFLITFYSNKKTKIKINKEIIFVYSIIIILLIEWFINHPTLRYGGYSLIAVLLFIPFSLILEKFDNNLNLIKKKTFIVILIGITIFIVRNIDRIIKENEKYNYNILLNPYYKIDNSLFRVENQIENLIKNYNFCQDNKPKCNKYEQYVVRKKMDKYIFKRKK